MAQGRVNGLDLNKAMLAVARTLPIEGVPVDWIEGSALDLPFAAGSVDLVLCQLGLQFAFCIAETQAIALRPFLVSGIIGALRLARQ
jgi:ubiquinone/menaquinone biosynthesis C-methylase UbiE